MKHLLKLALAGAFATVLVRWVARQWSTESADSDEIPTLNPVQEAGPAVAEAMGREDQPVTPKWPF